MVHGEITPEDQLLHLLRWLAVTEAPLVLVDHPTIDPGAKLTLGKRKTGVIGTGIVKTVHLVVIVGLAAVAYVTGVVVQKKSVCCHPNSIAGKENYSRDSHCLRSSWRVHQLDPQRCWDYNATIVVHF